MRLKFLLSSFLAAASHGGREAASFLAAASRGVNLHSDGVVETEIWTKLCAKNVDEIVRYMH